MKKKQLAKLKQQFRPSYETARQQLFTAFISILKIKRNY